METMTIGSLNHTELRKLSLMKDKLMHLKTHPIQVSYLDPLMDISLLITFQFL